MPASQAARDVGGASRIQRFEAAATGRHAERRRRRRWRAEWDHAAGRGAAAAAVPRSAADAAGDAARNAAGRAADADAVASRAAAAAGAECAGQSVPDRPAADSATRRAWRTGRARRAWRWRVVSAGAAHSSDQAGRQPLKKARVTLGLFLCARITPIMSASPPVVRGGEYAARGDYHREPDPSWDYYPTYLAKLAAVRAWLERASSLDARPRRRLRRGRARRASTPTASRSKASTRTTRRSACTPARSLRCPMPQASSIARCASTCSSTSPSRSSRSRSPSCTACCGPAASCWCRSRTSRTCSRACTSCCRGRLIRTASEFKHPGDRPVGEYLRLAERAGLRADRTARASFRPCRC